jgi:hypothetical protein
LSSGIKEDIFKSHHEKIAVQDLSALAVNLTLELLKFGILLK